MTRKGKAFLIGSVVPIITLWVWAFVARDYLMTYWNAALFTGPAILVGGLAGMIASVCTSGPPMSRKAKVALIVFYCVLVAIFGGFLL